jgi:diketogulonate reductase-like aldo/keto reductase
MAADLRIHTRIKLKNGILPGTAVEMPIFGLGTFLARRGYETRETVTHALHTGYRLIDTAKVYGNERDVGEAVKTSSIPREEIFITTKVWNLDQGYQSTLRACRESLDQLGLEYIDLYLIHWPVKEKRLDTWRALEELLEQGKCRAIGVSNYTIRHLEELLEKAEISPAVNQVEFSPFLYQRDLLEFCRRQGIQVEAYSPLTKGQKLSDPRLVAIAENHGKSPAQVLIRWALQHELVVIPKSVHRERIAANANVFDFSLTAEEMETLDGCNEDFRTSWDPTTVP